jgi:hypothetical protein
VRVNAVPVDEPSQQVAVLDLTTPIASLATRLRKKDVEDVNMYLAGYAGPVVRKLTLLEGEKCNFCNTHCNLVETASINVNKNSSVGQLGEMSECFFNM